jgi:uncharacterized protein (UPF0332 family)
MAVVDPDQLLEQADRLVAWSDGAPRQIDLRRAISNAYYALFHAVTTEAADDVVGRTHRQTPRYQLVYRRVEHRSLLRLCEDVVKSTLPAKYSDYEPAGGFGADLQFFAGALVDLQEKRHLADYDPLFRVTKSEAVLAVETGRTALVRFRNANRTQRKAFVSLVLFAPR